jgi:outer membrane receptor protein involved in Fe transport
MGVRARQPSPGIATVVATTLRAAALCAPPVLWPPAAVAQSAAPATLSAAIAAQPIRDALMSFTNQTGLELVYVSGVVRDQRSHAVPAGLGADAALTRLLRGTGLRYEYLTPRTVRILAIAPHASAALQDDEAQEVIVTANRRIEAAQDVPISIQVLTNATLAKLNVSTFDDFVGYLPGVTAHGVGPGQNNIYVRGLGAGETGTQGGGFVASFPSVAVYLDEQAVQLPNRNLDVYAADLERIEVLEGPQGTLFGAGAEAGVLRYITNKPKLNVTEGQANAGAGTTSHGGTSYAVTAMVNLPLITDRLAVRAVIYDDRRGGYIDNIPATFYRTPTDYGIAFYNGGVVPAGPVINNHALVGKAFNPVSYQGTRVEALYQFNDDWSALIAQSYQSMEADGVSAEMATNALGQPQPDLSVQLFNPSYNKDRFENTALTVNGHVGSLELLYAGSYLVRNVEQQEDYTAYSHAGFYVDYYQCINFSGNPYTADPNAQCFTPSAYWRDRLRNTHQSHELRVTTPAGARVRAVGGLFYERYTTQDQLDWYYLTAIPYFNPIGPPTGDYMLNGQVVCGCTQGAQFVPGLGVTATNPNVRPPGDGFFNDVTRGYTQSAAYSSLDFELIPSVLTLTAGTRYYRTTSMEVGATVTSFECSLLPPNPQPVPNPCINREFINLNALDLHRSYSGFRSRANLSWKLGEQALLYYTWSQGFRPGVFNRGLGNTAFSPLSDPLLTGGTPAAYQQQAALHGGWSPPLALAPDTLTNNEIGWKSSWFDQRLVWNGALYQENWDHVQIGALDATVVGGAIVNGGDYVVRGLEVSGEARLGDGFSLDFGAAWNHSELTREAVFLWADGTPIDFSTLHDGFGRPISNPAGTLGSPLAGSPPFQGNARVRYQFNFNGYEAFAQLGAVHQSHSLATVDRLTVDAQGNSVYYDLPAFTTYNAALGFGKQAWQVQVYGENLTDTRAELYASYRQYYKAITVNRPRTVGLRMTYNIR